MRSNAGDNRLLNTADREAEQWYARLQRDDDPVTVAAFEAWLTRSAENRPAYDRLLSVLEMGDMLRNTQTGSARKLGKAPIWQRQSVRQKSTAAALVLLVIGGAGLMVQQSAAPAPQIASSDVIIEALEGRSRTVALKDGSRAVLHPGSRLRIAYTAQARRLDLSRGQARFHVQDGDPRPFMVTTPGGAIIAHGTVFDVAIADRQTRVALIRGSIEVQTVRQSPDAPVRARFLSPGQEVVLTEGSDRVPPPHPVMQNGNVSKDDMLSFDAAALTEAVDALNQRNQRKVSLADPAIGGLRVTGAFRFDDPAGFASAVAALFRLVVREQADGSLIIARHATEAK